MRSTAVVSAMTLLSRIFGYLRDMVIAVSFGATGATDAFFVAFRIPNFLRRLFAEGAFSQAFVPVFSEYRERRDGAALKDLVDHVAGALLVALAGVTALGVVGAPLIIAVFAPGYLDDPQRFGLASGMLRVTFPYLLFISLTALAAGILNSLGRFGVPAFTPVLLNVSLIGAALWLAPRMAEPVTALAWGVFIAGAAQLALQLPFLTRAGLLPRPRLRRAHPGVRRILRLMLPAIFGVSIVQINLLFDTLIASFLASGSISWLYYSDRFVELPLALFGIALSTVALPRLSSLHATRDVHGFRATLDWALRSAFLVAVPAALGLILLAGPILATLVQYRAFSAQDTEMARLSLMAYALGLPAFMGIKILAPGFYARQDTTTPVKIGVIAMLANMGLNVLFVVPWVGLDLPGPHAGLALATSASAWLNAALLRRRLIEEGVYERGGHWGRLLAASAAAGLLMTVLLAWVTPPLTQWSAWGAAQRVATLTGLIAAGALGYAAALWMGGVRPALLHPGVPGGTSPGRGA